jgi:crossover junction endodeoxyribonuclease RuvC
MAFDPGSVSGAYAVVDAQGRFVTVGDLPVSSLGGAGKSQVNPALLAKLIREIKPDLAVIEQVGAMPGNGTVAMFRFGQASGLIIGVIAALQIPWLLVSPHVWKKAAGLTGQPKDASRTKALALFPEAAPFLERKKDHNKADALLIAKYCPERHRHDR